MQAKNREEHEKRSKNDNENENLNEDIFTLSTKNMNYSMLRKVLLGFALLSSVAAGAQQFETDLQLSTEETEYWYRICNASAGMQAYAMTDCSSVDETYPVQLLATEMTDAKSQWTLTAGLDGKVVFTNRATNKQLANTSVEAGNHNATQLTTEGAQGFKITELGEASFTMEGAEDDGVNRCLAMTEREADALTYPSSDAEDSAIAWKFMLAETIITKIQGADTKTVIRVAGRRIYVSGCPQWQLFSINGMEMPCTTTLPVGIYIVKTPKTATKVVVR